MERKRNLLFNDHTIRNKNRFLPQSPFFLKYPKKNETVTLCQARQLLGCTQNSFPHIKVPSLRKCRWLQHAFQSSSALGILGVCALAKVLLLKCCSFLVFCPQVQHLPLISAVAAELLVRQACAVLTPVTSVCMAFHVGVRHRACRQATQPTGRASLTPPVLPAQCLLCF